MLEPLKSRKLPEEAQKRQDPTTEIGTSHVRSWNEAQIAHQDPHTSVLVNMDQESREEQAKDEDVMRGPTVLRQRIEMMEEA